MNRYFFTGAPGSRWSALAQIIEDAGDFDISDRNSNRNYNHEAFTGHKGMYFGKNMECNALLDAQLLDSYFECNRSRLIKSHDWSYNLEDVNSFCKSNNDKLIMVYRDSETCFDWWIQAGGFSITYPDYSWYESERKMFTEILKQNRNILEFVNKHRLNLVSFSNEWLQQHFNSKKQYDVSLFENISVAII